MNDVAKVRWSLRSLGLSDSAIDAAWPSWWSDDAAASISAHAELRFSLARKLGLDARSLLGEQQPRFVWRGHTKFKHLSTEKEFERDAITAFGVSLARALLSATPGLSPLGTLRALEVRQSILAHQPFVRLLDVLGTCWALGVPVIHLRVFPLSAKRMCAMAVRVGERFAILLGKDAVYPPAIAFYVAHELGHIALSHVNDSEALVDLEDPLKSRDHDKEEKDADEYALELLTGSRQLAVGSTAARVTAAQLAHNVLHTGPQVHIEPGTLALCFGYSSGRWPTVAAAMRRIYSGPRDVWQEVNRVALSQLNLSELEEDLRTYVGAIMGGLSRA